MLFLLLYLSSLLRNLTIIIVTTIDQNLHAPMYFFLRNLSILDMYYVSVTVPNACGKSCTHNRAQECYVAMCQPLLYPVIMNHQACVQVILASLLLSLIIAGSHTVKTFRLSFCNSNVVPQFFCDVLSAEALLPVLILLTAIIISGSYLIFIMVSYVHIFSTVLKFPLKEERKKAFSTCVAHIIMVSLFLISGAYVYLRPPVISEVIQDMILSVLYANVTPFLNPIICSLRNKQINEGVSNFKNI
ncbi:olfactory receptor 14C36-like [Nannospalax galili]|uniref:olfactory receptor 14C36-like n=1 Tax=Nannospalax galili TaxID=1026970 RepID=UPI00111C0716|nr:olfactory receptor 14C36-like [Nannospalax galili]